VGDELLLGSPASDWLGTGGVEHLVSVGLLGSGRLEVGRRQTAGDRLWGWGN
jgi:hypothetical protein